MGYIIRTVDELGEVQRLIDQAHGNTVVLDSETTGLDMFGLKDRRAMTSHKGPFVEEELIHGPARICGLVVCVPLDTDELRQFYLPYRHEGDAGVQLPVETMPRLTEQIERRRMTVIGHNIKFDLKMLRKDGCFLGNADQRITIEDTMILEHVLQSDVEKHARYNLGVLAANRIGHDPSLKAWVGDEVKRRRYRRYSQFGVEELADYAMDDGWMTWGIRKQMKPRLLDPNPPWYGGPDQLDVYETDNRLLWVLLRMEERGIKVDKERCLRISAELTEKEGRIRIALYESAGREINIRSHKQMIELFRAKKWPLPRDKMTNIPLVGLDSDDDEDPRGASFADVWLQQLQCEEPDFLSFRDAARQLRSLLTNRDMYLGSYLRLMDNDEVVHPQFRANGTVTGRLSCSEPNFQNVRRKFGSISTRRETYFYDDQFEVRSVFIPHDDSYHFLGFDYSQQETRMFVNYSKEPTMRRILLEGGDIHHYAAEAMYKQPMPPKLLADGRLNPEYDKRRQRAKTMNFGILYSMGASKLAKSMEVEESWAREVWNNYMATFTGVRPFMNRVSEVAEARLWIRTAFNRRLRFRLLTDEEKRRGFVLAAIGRINIRPGQRALSHKALNYLIQGSCADLTRRAMIKMDDLLRGTESYLVNQVHDELLFEVADKERAELGPEIRRILEYWPQFEIPFLTTPKEPMWAWSDPSAKDVAEGRAEAAS